MSDVRTRVDETLRHVHLDTPDPAAAWQRGRRRRRVRAVAASAAAVAVVGVVASVVTDRGLPDALPPSSPTGTVGSVDDYPQRIDDPWFGRSLEDAPPRLAGTLRDSGHGQFGVSEAGDLYEIRQTGDTWGGHEAVLSDDGTKLAYLASPTSYVVRHLGTGEEVQYDGLGQNQIPSPAPYLTYDQTPGFWSPDGAHLLISGGLADGDGDTVLLLDDAGGFEVLPRPRKTWTAGWADASHPVFLGEQRGAAVLITTDLSGREVDRVELDVPRSVSSSLSQWSGSLSRGGDLMVVTDEARVLVEAGTGERLSPVTPANYDTTCPASWRRGSPLLTVPAESGAILVSALGAGVTTVVEPSLGTSCLHLVPNALDGGESYDILGLRTGWAAWHLGELVLGGLILVGATGGLLWWRRRRRVAG